jgi:hypothetical protein
MDNWHHAPCADAIRCLSPVNACDSCSAYEVLTANPAAETTARPIDRSRGRILLKLLGR